MYAIRSYYVTRRDESSRQNRQIRSLLHLANNAWHPPWQYFNNVWLRVLNQLAALLQGAVINQENSLYSKNSFLLCLLNDTRLRGQYSIWPILLAEIFGRMRIALQPLNQVEVSYNFV